MKRKLLLLICGLLIFNPTSIKADEIYYTNNYGLHFTEFQYNKMVERLSVPHVQNMSYKAYEMLGVANITEDNYEQVIYDEEPSSNNNRATYYETGCKKITISKACDSDRCLVTFTNNWKCIPAVKSYDVSGVRLSSTNYYQQDQAAFFTSNGVAKEPSGSRGASNGVGFAFKVPSSGDIGYSAVNITTDATNPGVVYGSYQHGVKSMSLTYALDFTFDSSGLGGVFSWDDNSYFDRTSGVYIVAP